MKHGQGIFKYRDDSKYVGAWINDLKDGKGAFTWADGNKFNGMWEKGDSRSGILSKPDGTAVTINV